MKTKLTIISALALIISLKMSAQNNIKFGSINMGGVITGKSKSTITLQTINGISSKKLFAGIGVGLDYYTYKSVPLFIDLRTLIGRTNFFIFADPGYNFPFKNTPDSKNIYFDTYHFYGGFYSEAGFGYKLRVVKNRYVLFSSGYSYKKINDKVSTVNECFAAPCPMNYSTYTYQFQRLIFKAGFLF
jgi:hypothetical protein